MRQVYRTPVPVPVVLEMSVRDLEVRVLSFVRSHPDGVSYRQVVQDISPDLPRTLYDRGLGRVYRAINRQIPKDIIVDRSEHRRPLLFPVASGHEQGKRTVDGLLATDDKQLMDEILSHLSLRPRLVTVGTMLRMFLPGISRRDRREYDRAYGRVRKILGLLVANDGLSDKGGKFCLSERYAAWRKSKDPTQAIVASSLEDLREAVLSFVRSRPGGVHYVQILDHLAPGIPRSSSLYNRSVGRVYAAVEKLICRRVVSIDRSVRRPLLLPVGPVLPPDPNPADLTDAHPDRLEGQIDGLANAPIETEEASVGSQEPSPTKEKISVFIDTSVFLLEDVDDAIDFVLLFAEKDSSVRPPSSDMTHGRVRAVVGSAVVGLRSVEEAVEFALSLRRLS